jgi:ABC-type lipoprotein release transport system permease subunit
MRRPINMLTRIAWRNLWRNHRRSLIMLTAISIGVWGMIWMTALMRGMVDQMIDDAIRTLSGHVQVHAPGYRDDPSVEHLMPVVDDNPALQELLAQPPVVAWSQRVRVPAVIRSEREVLGVTLVGIDPQREKGLSFIADSVSQGEYLANGKDQRVLLGRKLVERLETRLDRRIVLLSQDPDNNIAERGFRIAGIYDAELEATETSYVFAGIETIQQMLGIGKQVSELSLLGTDYRTPEALAEAVKAVSPGLAVQSWLELDPYMASMLNLMDGFILVWFIVIFLALSFGLVNTLLMAVFERTRELGLIQALGMPPSYILAMMLIEALIMLVIGLAVGNLLAWLTILPIRDGIDVSIVAEGLEFAGMGTTLTPALYGSDLLLANAVVLGLGIITSLYPAWRAASKVPVEAITRIWK